MQLHALVLMQDICRKKTCAWKHARVARRHWEWDVQASCASRLPYR